MTISVSNSSILRTRWNVNSNDGTIEGLAYEGGVSRSVQFYPDAGRGLYKSVDLYDEFIAALRSAK